ncbi:MAG TPA: hypothetical protein VKU41_32390, partial [Polyangiaceae bacterium]|nr:hypothetical protein [Polyangiaceae bacterium]
WTRGTPLRSAARSTYSSSSASCASPFRRAQSGDLLFEKQLQDLVASFVFALGLLVQESS